MGANRKQITLHEIEARGRRPIVDLRQCPTDHRIQFVNIAIGTHARIRFRHARTAKQSSLTVIACACVNALGHVSTLPVQ
jgi:hypothetical protein